MDTTQLRAALSKASAPRLSQLSGVSMKTIYRIRDGEADGYSPRMETVEKLTPHIDASAKRQPTEGKNAQRAAA